MRGLLKAGKAVEVGFSDAVDNFHQIGCVEAYGGGVEFFVEVLVGGFEAFELEGWGEDVEEGFVLVFLRKRKRKLLEKIAVPLITSIISPQVLSRKITVSIGRTSGWLTKLIISVKVVEIRSGREIRFNAFPSNPSQNSPQTGNPF